MEVQLLETTPNALAVLVFTKNTRLSMTGVGYKEVLTWPEEKLMEEWRYMQGTIQSSWEFVDYIFAISVVSRAFTHQLVRHRVGTSFAQQAQRAVDMTGFEYITGPSIDSPERLEEWIEAMQNINIRYQRLLQDGVNKQDARGILPTNIATNIIFKANLRTLHEMARKRLCVKAQGEFQNVFRAIRDEVLNVHPWADVLHAECATNGTCIFPSYPVKDCPVKKHVYNPITASAYGFPFQQPLPLHQIRRIHKELRAEAQP
jgi:flavin-dependent thymidylate synthase